MQCMRWALLICGWCSVSSGLASNLEGGARNVLMACVNNYIVSLASLDTFSSILPKQGAPSVWQASDQLVSSGCVQAHASILTTASCLINVCIILFVYFQEQKFVCPSCVATTTKVVDDSNLIWHCFSFTLSLIYTYVLHC